MNRSLNLAIAVLLLIGCVALTIAADKQEKKALEKVKVETRKDSGKVISLSAETMNPFLKSNCFRCHGPDKQQGKMRLDTLSFQMDDDAIAQRWQDVLDALNAGDMPPEDEKQPTKKELTEVLATLTDGLKVARRQLSGQGREVSMRRLNRREYVNSIESLFGFRINPELLPEDDPADPFDTIGSQQSRNTWQ